MRRFNVLMSARADRWGWSFGPEVEDNLWDGFHFSVWQPHRGEGGGGRGFVWGRGAALMMRFVFQLKETEQLLEVGQEGVGGFRGRRKPRTARRTED